MATHSVTDSYHYGSGDGYYNAPHSTLTNHIRMVGLPPPEPDAVRSGRLDAIELQHLPIGADRQSVSLAITKFGGALLNEAKFQAIVDQVTDAISADEGSSQLLGKVIGELSAPSSTAPPPSR